MYIAFKWLLGLTVVMWAAMCCVDVYVKKSILLTDEGLNTKAFNSGFDTLDLIANRTDSAIKINANKYRRIGDINYNMTSLHCFMFVAGALVVSVYININDLIIITKNEFSSITTRFHTPIVIIRQVATMLLIKIWTILKYITITKSNQLSNMFKFNIFKKQRINLVLLKKITEIGKERKNLARLLLAAIRENKNIRMQYQLENIEKKRLACHIENTEKVIKENSFQQLYLMTNQENSLLKFRINKLTKDKEEVEKKFMELLNEVYKSKNNELKSYCSRFIVQTKRNLLNTDVSAEIQKFLYTPRASSALDSQIAEYPEVSLHRANSWLKYQSISSITEVINYNSMKPLLSEAPKLKGLPGEYVWTVKDKDGLIEKLYECDCGADYDNGDTIRRIREYSVYHNKDCLLDFSNSANTIEYESKEISTQYGPSSCSTNVDAPLTSQRFLTGSEAFKKFMIQTNGNVVSKSIFLPTPRFLSD